jgi:hypothetical protein
MILEGIVTTRTPSGEPHLAPMGPRFGSDPRRFVLRPFPTSSTYQNLLKHPAGVLHVTDDVLLLARAAVGRAILPPLRAAHKVQGFILETACRALEFVVREADATGERMSLHCEIVREERLRDFWGFNRAKHAVLEAAILCTRLHLIPKEEVEAEFRKLKVIVEKTAGPQEFEAFEFLQQFLLEASQLRKPL